MRRRATGNDSRTCHNAPISIRIDIAVIAHSTARQPALTKIRLPRLGATAGATATSVAKMLNKRAACAPELRSEITARLSTTPAEALTPCRNRNAINQAMVGDSATATEDSTKTLEPISNGRIRPYRSDSGPNSSWPALMPSRKAVSVSWMAEAPTSKSCAMRGKAGR